MSQGFDCATKLNSSSAVALRSAGFEYVARYLPTSAWKGLTADEANAIKQAGLKLVSVFEKGATKSSYFTKSQGVSDAQEAHRLAKSIGQPSGSAIYFTVDYDAQPADMPAIIEYLNGIKQLLTDYKIGLYGSYNVMQAVRGHVDYYWQTYAWSRGKIADFIHMRQYQNGVTVAGVQLDKDEIKQAPGEWGSNREEEEMLEKAIVLGGFPDFAPAEILAARLKAPIFTRAALPAGKIAKEVYVVGGPTEGLQGDKIISLTGADRFEVAAAVKKFIG